MQPSAEKILSVLVDLYAKQMGVKVNYKILRSVENAKQQECKFIRN